MVANLVDLARRERLEPALSRIQKAIDLPTDIRPRGATWTLGGDALIVGTIRRTSHLVLFDQAK